MSQDQTYYLDAKSGELLPLKEDPTPRIKDDSAKSNRIYRAKLKRCCIPAFDPYDRLPWIQGTPLPVTKLE